MSGKKEINGVSMIPFGLVAGFADGLEIRITELAENGFCFWTTPENGYPKEKVNKETENSEYDEKKYDSDGYLCGVTGCGLCALYRLREAGITHLKLVGRGNYVNFMEKDIRNLRAALEILENTGTEEEYIRKMKRELFIYGCSGMCYYTVHRNFTKK